MKKRLLELDSLRGLAALVVVLYHYFYRYDSIYGHQGVAVDWIFWGKYGVEVFFMVSGFVIFWTLQKLQNPLDFIVSRVSRLYPVYWISVILTYFLVLLCGLDGRDVGFFDALINLSMLQGFFKVQSVDGVYWTLMVEIIFYFWIFILFILKLHQKSEIILCGVVIANVLDIIFLLDISSVLRRLLIFDYMSFFVSGICFYKIINAKKSNWSILVLFFCLLSTAISYSLSYFPFFIALYFVFYLSVSGRLRIMSNRYLVYLGGISYALYLVHQNIGYIIINTFYDYGLEGFFGIITAMIVSLSIAIVLTKYVEKPALMIIRTAYSKIKLYMVI